MFSTCDAIFHSKARIKEEENESYEDNRQQCDLHDPDLDDDEFDNEESEEEVEDEEDDEAFEQYMFGESE